MPDGLHLDADRLAGLVRMVHDTGYSFVTPTPATHARVLGRPGHEWARDVRDVLGWSRPFRGGIMPDGLFGAMHAAGVLARHCDGWHSTIRISSLDGLSFCHSAYPTEAADSVFFGPDTYRFAQAIACLPDRPVRRAVDIGCGAGPGAVLVARRWPEANVIAVDVNPVALRMAGANAAASGVRVRAAESDLLAAVDGQFDLIVANPPYMADPAGRAYRDGGGPLGAGLSVRIIEIALDRLAPGGTLLLYTGAAVVNGQDPFRAAANDRLAGTGLVWGYREVDPDVFGEELEGGAYVDADRIAAVVLTVRKEG